MQRIAKHCPRIVKQFKEYEFMNLFIIKNILLQKVYLQWLSGYNRWCILKRWKPEHFPFTNLFCIKSQWLYTFSGLSTSYESWRKRWFLNWNWLTRLNFWYVYRAVFCRVILCYTGGILLFVNVFMSTKLLPGTTDCINYYVLSMFLCYNFYIDEIYRFEYQILVSFLFFSYVH